MKTITLSVLAALCLAGAASAGDLYSIGGNCSPGEEGVIEIGNGRFSATETQFERAGAKRDAGDGFFEAEYDLMVEGEPYGQETVRMRVTDAAVDVVYADGRSFTAKRCG